MLCMLSSFRRINMFSVLLYIYHSCVLWSSFDILFIFYFVLFICLRMFVVQQIPESNLLMLVVQGDCDCSRQYPPITLEPKEVKYIL